MKKLLILSACVLATAGALAQGTVNFANTPTTLITSLSTGLGVPTGSMTVGLYYGVVGTTDPTIMTLLKTTGIAPVLGRYTGGTVTTPATTAGGAAAVFEVRAWSGAYASYEAAVAAGNSIVGRSGLVNVAVTGNPAGVPPTAPAGLGAPAFTVANVVPEPSTIALGLLGLGALLIRRRK
jgi:hypothetical protein